MRGKEPAAPQGDDAMKGLRGPPGGGKRAATSVRENATAGERLPAANDDGDGFAATVARALDAAMEATVPVLRAHLQRELAAHLRPSTGRSPRRRGLRAGDDAPVDDVTRAKARALLKLHGGRA